MINRKYKNDRVEEIQKLYRLRELINDEVLDKEYPDFKVTKEFKDKVKSGCVILTNCDARMRMGNFYTDEEYQKYREESLSRPLPGDENFDIKQKVKNNRLKILKK